MKTILVLVLVFLPLCAFSQKKGIQIFDPLRYEAFLTHHPYGISTATAKNRFKAVQVSVTGYFGPRSKGRFTPIGLLIHNGEHLNRGDKLPNRPILWKDKRGTLFASENLKQFKAQSKFRPGKPVRTDLQAVAIDKFPTKPNAECWRTYFLCKRYKGQLVVIYTQRIFGKAWKVVPATQKLAQSYGCQRVYWGDGGSSCSPTALLPNHVGFRLRGEAT